MTLSMIRLAALPRHPRRSPLAVFQRQLRTLGLRREDPSRIWERRTALTPQAVGSLLAEHNAGGNEELRAEVESCGRRCFPDQEYANIGAKLVPALSKEVDVVLGIKEPAVSAVQSLLAGQGGQRERTWMMFSHTHKGQEYNTPLLSSFLTPTTGQTLVDHELLTAPSVSTDGKITQKRVAAFGWYAGAVGAGEALSLTGLALLKRGMATPLLHLSRPYTFGTLAEFKTALCKAGEVVKSATPTESNDGPIVIGVVGGGNVAQGAIEMLKELEVEWVMAEQLSGLKGTASNKIYACAVKPADYLVPLNGGSYNRDAYRSSPEDYMSVFTERIAPYLTGLINGVSWSAAYPRLISNDDLKTLLEMSQGRPKLVAVQDISCDREGGLQFVNQFTTIDQPYFEGQGGMLISSIDILPTELAADASTHFSERILPYVRRALFPRSPAGDAAAESETMERAAIVSKGKLNPEHTWLQSRLTAWQGRQSPESTSAPARATASSSAQTSATTLRAGQKKKVLLLGSGLVAGPAVEVFAARSDVQLAVASNNLAEARNLIRDRTNVQAISLDVADQSALSEVVAAADVVVSLLPAPMHPAVAEHCIRHDKHLVTASYISPEMKLLDEQAKRANIILLGECGLDPGIDSMAAMRILDQVKREGKRVKSFVSWCGGLPELSASNVPLRYKFSWSPKAVLTAAQNDAKFKLNGEVVEIPGEDLLSRHFLSVNLWDGLPMEGLANRDSMPYAEKYGLGDVDGLTDLFRGTLRYQGFSRLLASLKSLGLLRADPLPLHPAARTWPDFLLATIAREVGHSRLRREDINGAIGDLVGSEQVAETLQALEWFSMLPTNDGANSSLVLPAPSIHADVGAGARAPIDLFAHLLSQRLAYSPGERDTCYLHHAFTLSTSSPASPSFPQTQKENEHEHEQRVTASLLHHGDGDALTQSSMSITVGKTLAFAALRVLDGQVKQRGVIGPYEREVWEGVLGALEGVGVVVEEKWT